MSFAKVDVNAIDMETALTNLVASIALEEAGLAHIINAEGEKIQAVINESNITTREMTAVNKSVKNTIKSISKIENSLQLKFDDIYGILPIDGFYFHKRGANGDLLNGGKFVLRNDDYTIYTDARNGIVNFGIVPPGDYELIEEFPPVGYVFDATGYQAHIFADGKGTIDGMKSNEFVFVNVWYIP
jgi:hypothetical protein